MSFTSFCLSLTLSIWNLFCLSLFVVALMLIASHSYASCRPFNPHVHCVNDLINPRYHHNPHHRRQNIHRHSDNSYFHGHEDNLSVNYPILDHNR